MTRVLAVLIGALLAALLAVVPARAQQEFKIGVVMSLSGGFVAAAKDTMDGVQAWLKTRGLPGRKVTFEILDDETNPVSAINAYRRLAGNPDIKLIYLFINSSSALAVKSLASEFKVPIVSGGAADALGFPPDPYLFKVAPGVRDFMTVLAQYAQKKGLQARRAAQHDRCVRAERSQVLQGAGAAARHRGGRRRNDGGRRHQLQCAAHQDPRRAPGHDLQWRREPRRDPELEADQAARVEPAVDRHPGGGEQGVLRRDRRAEGGGRADDSDPARLVRRGGRRRHREAVQGAEGRDAHAGRLLRDLRLRRRSDHRGGGQEFRRQPRGPARRA
jgi:hypothetical protein